MGKLSSLKQDIKKAVEGRWVEFAGMEFLVARMNNPRYTEFLSNHRRLSATKLSVSTIQALTIEGVAKFVLLDWKNVVDEMVPPSKDVSERNTVLENGMFYAPLNYTPELGQKLLSNPEYRDLYDFIVTEASNSDEYRAESLKAAEGN